MYKAFIFGEEKSFVSLYLQKEPHSMIDDN